MNFIKISIGILLILSASRFIPHPPNFTSLQALSFYLPVIFGVAYLPVILISFIITDIFIGFHQTLFFTWGSIVIIGLFSRFFVSKIYKYRILGALGGALIFYLMTNFGVWLTGSYGYTFSGIFDCYILAIPFFGNTLISTLIYAIVIEILIKIKDEFLFYKRS